MVYTILKFLGLRQGLKIQWDSDRVIRQEREGWAKYFLREEARVLILIFIVAQRPR